MKTVEIAQALIEKAKAGDTNALAAMLVYRGLSDLDDRLTAIDGVLTEIRSTLQENG